MYEAKIRKQNGQIIVCGFNLIIDKIRKQSITIIVCGLLIWREVSVHVCGQEK
jgi:hypothetical protein